MPETEALPAMPDIARFLAAEQRQANIQAFSAFDEDPEKAARALELERATGVPAPLIHGDLEGFEREHKAALTSQVLDSNAFLREFMNSHPMAAAVSNDDVGALDTASESMAKVGSRSLPKIMAKQFVEKFGPGPLGQWMGAEYAHAHPVAWAGWSVLGMPIELPMRLFPATLAAINVGTEETLVRLGMDPDSAGRFARDTTGMAEMWVQFMSGGMAKKPAAAPKAEVFAGALKAATELDATGAPKYWGAGKEVPVGIHPLFDKMHIEQAKLDAKALNDAVRDAGATATRERAPELFADFARPQTEGTIGISADAVRKLYGEKEPTAEDGLLGWIPDLVQQLSTAEEIGGRVEVPAAEFLAKVDPKVYKELKDDISVRKGGVTLNEGKELQERADFAEGGEPADKKFYLEKPANENVPIEERLPEPLTREERDWQNYGSKMSPDDVLASEIVWAEANRAAESGEGRAEGFARYANRMWGLMGANRYITPELAQRYMRVEEARSKGIKAIEGKGEPLTNPAALARREARVDPAFGPKLELRRVKRGFPPPSDMPQIGENFHDFKMVDERGKVVGGLWLSVREDGKRLFVDDWRSMESQGYGPNAFGPSLILSVVRQLMEEFPKAEWIGGHRVSGAREAAGTEKVIWRRLRDTDDVQAMAVELEWTQAETGIGNGEAVIPEGAQGGQKVAWKGVETTSLASFKASDALGLIDRGNLEGVAKVLADFFHDKLGKLAGDVPIHVIPDADMAAIGKASGFDFIPRGVHLLSNGERQILLPESLANGSQGPGAATHTIVHELAHAATVRAMLRDRGTLRTVETMLKETVAHLQEVDPEALGLHKQAFKNAYEFMAEAFSKPEFQKVLATTPISEELAAKLQLSKDIAGGTVWDAIRHIVSGIIERAIGVRPDATILDGVLRVGNLIEHQERQPGGFAEHTAFAEGKELDPRTAADAKAEVARLLPSVAKDTTKAIQPELPGTRRLEDTEAFSKAAFRGMSAKQQERYVKLMDKENREAIERMAAQALADERRRQTEEWKRDERRVRGEVEQDVATRPAVLADDFFRNSMLHGQKLDGKPRLDASKLTEEQKAALPKDWYQGKGPIVDPDLVAKEFGYPSGDAMIEHLGEFVAQRAQTGMQPKEFLNAVIKDETERRMAKEHGDLERNIMDEAREHAIGQTTMDIIHEEVQALGMEAGGQISISKADLQAWVRQAFDQMPLSAIDKEKFLALSNKAVRQAELVTPEGKVPSALAAFKAKQVQEKALLLAREAIALEKRQKQAARLFKTLSKREPAGIAPEYVEMAQSIMMQVGAEPRVRRSPMDLRREIEARGNTTLEAFVQAKQDATFGMLEIPVPEFLFNPNFRKTFEQLTAEEFRGVHDAVKALVKLGRDELKVLREGAAQNRAELKARMIEHIETFPVREYKETPGRMAKIMALPRTFIAGLTNTETFLNRLGRGDPLSVFNKHIVYPLAEAANMKAKFDRQFAKVYQALGPIKDQDKAIAFPFEVKGGEPITGFTRKNLMAIVQNMGNESNWNVLTKGYGFDPVALRQWVFDNTTKADWDRAQAMGDMFGRAFRMAETVYRHITGVAPERIELVPFETPFGTYEGWYHPLIKHPTREGGSKRQMGGGVYESGDNFHAATANGYTKRRTGATYPLDLNFDMVPVRLSQMLHDVAFRQVIIETEKLFSDKELRAAITKHYGKEYTDGLLPYLRGIAGAEGINSPAFAMAKRASEFLRQNAISTYIGFNIYTVLKHTPTAAWLSAAQVGPLKLAQALKDIYFSQKDIRDSNNAFIKEWFEEVNRRERHWQETTIGQHRDIYGEGNLREKIIEKGSWMVAQSDLVFTKATALAAYREAREAGHSHGTAIDLADRAVRRTHGSTAVTNQPALVRGGGPLHGWVTSIYGFFGTVMQRRIELAHLINDTYKLGREGEIKAAAKKMPEVVSSIVTAVIIPTLIEEAVTGLTTEDRRGWGAHIVSGAAMGMAASALYLRDIMHGWLTGQEPGVGLLSSLLHDVTRLKRDLAQGKKMFSKEHAGTLVQDAITVTGLATGMAPKEIGNLAKFGIDLSTGQQKPKRPGEWALGLTRGNIKARVEK